VQLDSAAAMNPYGDGARFSKAGLKVRLYLYVKSIGTVTWQNEKYSMNSFLLPHQYILFSGPQNFS
jgi:hypothetical protein